MIYRCNNPLCVIAAVIALALSSNTARSQAVIRVTDGDTFIAQWNGDTVKVRLCGVDAPESRENPKARKDAKRSGQDIEDILTLGKQSSDFLKSVLAPGTVVRFEFDVSPHDRYGRLLAYVYLPDGRMVNSEMVKSGMANTMTIPPNVRYAERFRSEESEAKKKRFGLWK